MSGKFTLLFPNASFRFSKGMPIRMLTTETRRKLEEILDRLSKGDLVTLQERIQLKKYAIHIPFIAGKLTQAHRQREALEADGLI